jgi:hypothetical protein
MLFEWAGEADMILNRRGRFCLAAVVIAIMSNNAVAVAATIRSVTVFAVGTDVNATAPDSIAVTEHSIWASYANGADSTGLNGDSTVVEYDFLGRVLQTFVVKGSVDGLKVDPRTGLVWALQNQDGNSTLTLINPATATTSLFSYAVMSATRGYDDVVFLGTSTFLSYTNPTENADATIQMLVPGSNPLAVTTILTKGARGTDLATGRRNRATAQNDPDSLKLTPFGDLELSSGDDGQLIFVQNPGTDDQAVSFLTLLDPQSGQAVSGLDDAVFATARQGVFYLAETGHNRILAITVDDLEFGSLFASVSSLNALASVDTRTGVATPFVTNLKGPHGLVFVPLSDDE